MFLALVFLVVALTGILYALRLYNNSHDKLWIKQGVPFVKSGDVCSPIDRLLQKVNIADFDEGLYKLAGDVPYFGYTDLMAPALYVKDLDLYKQIAIKDFDHFAERRIVQTSKGDKMFARMLTNVTGNEWKDLRSIMSPTFSTGKIRRMFELFNQCADGLADFLRKKAKTSNEYDFVDAFGRFTMAAISSVAFGQQTDTYEDNSVFRKMAKQLNTFSIFRFLKFFVMISIPKFAQALGLTIFDKESAGFFQHITEQNIAQRKKDGVKRNDFLQLLLEAQQGRLAKTDESELSTFEKDALLKDHQDSSKSAAVMDDDTVTSQSILFFAAGADTLESALTFIAYEMALNPDVQEKLAGEIQRAFEKNKGELTYEVLNSMEYLDMVVSESFRLHPPAFATERHCTKQYTLPGTNVVVPKGTRILLPIRQIHHDPKYYPNPTKFNPENFSAEAKANRHPYAYSPFGQGPRNCIAMRFAIVEAKAAIAHLIYNFQLEPSSKTEIPVKKSSTATILKPANGMWLKFKERDHTNGDSNGFVKV